MPKPRGKKVVANFTNAHRIVSTVPIFAIDYGQQLIIKGLDLPQAFEVHFSKRGGEAKPQIGTVIDGVGVVDFLDEQTRTAGQINAYIYLHEGTDDGETEYIIRTMVANRPNTTPVKPTPVQQDVITQAIAALDVAVKQTAEDVQTTNKNAQQTSEDMKSTEAARKRAEEAQSSAEKSAESASSDAKTAAEKAREGVTAAESASKDAKDAKEAAESAKKDARSADESARKAEESVTRGGYVKMMIDERGHLIYQRTYNVDFDFKLDKGHLVMEVN